MSSHIIKNCINIDLKQTQEKDLTSNQDKNVADIYANKQQP